MKRFLLFFCFILFITACYAQRNYNLALSKSDSINLNIDSLYSIACKYERESNLKGAIETYKKIILVIDNDSKDNEETLEKTLKHVSKLYYQLKYYPQAISYIIMYGNKVKMRYGLESIEYALALNNIAAFYHEIGNDSDAIYNGNIALSIADSLKLHNSPFYAAICTNLAMAYCIQNGDSAALMFNKALNTMEACNMEESIEMGIIQSDYADFLFHCELDSSRAISLYKSAQKIIKQNVGENNDQYSNILRKIATFYRVSSPQLSIDFDTKATFIQKGLYGDNSIQYANALFFLAYDYALQDAYNKTSIKSYQNVVYEILQKAHKIHRTYLLESLGEFNAIDREYFWNEYHSLRVLLPLSCNLYESDDLNSLLYDDLLFSKNLLLRLDSKLRTDSLETAMIFLSENNISWREIQAKLSDEDIAIEFGMYGTNDDEYYALLLSRGMKAPMFVPLFSEKELFNLRGDSLYSQWEPLLEGVIGYKNVYFSADGILNIYPIERILSILPELKSEEINIYRLSSTGNLLYPSSKVNIKRAILYGGLNYYESEENYTQNFPNEGCSRVPCYSTRDIGKCDSRSGFDFLNNSLLEVKDINELLIDNGVECEMLTGERGTEKSFISISGKPVDLIHIATHGAYVQQNVKLQSFLKHGNERMSDEEEALYRSMLILSGANKILQKDSIQFGMNDGILTAYEISKLNLQSVDIIILSACDTALGDISHNGVYGLQRGLKKAGANTILMSLDKVDDEATKVFMVEFYKNLMGGKTKLQSLKDAQMHLRRVDNGKYDDPKYWASFILLDGIN